MKVKKVVLAIVFLFSSIIFFGFNLLVESDNRALENSDLGGHRETIVDIEYLPGWRKHTSFDGLGKSGSIENLSLELLFTPEDCSNGIDDDGDGFIDNADSDCNYTTQEIIPTGSYIINMGVRPQTVKNALLPYGLVWELLNSQNIPIIWSINASKSKDGVDFVHASKSYRGAPFIIKKEYLSPSVLNSIKTWENKGVVVETTTTEITVPVYQTLSYSMHWTLNAENGDIAKTYLDRAQIPQRAYDWVSPEDINCCTDVYLMPHSDPTWSTHGNLLYWNAPVSEGGCRGSLWVGCRAVSNIENIQNPSNPQERMNFLMEDPILPETDPAVADHEDGSMPPAYKMGYPSDPLMQFMGPLDGAQENGAEQIYLPTNAWRPTTYISIWDDSHDDVPSLSPGPAAKLAFGHAFGEEDRGYILYTGGHKVDKEDKEPNIAAQRAMLNFAFQSSGLNAIIVSEINVPPVMESGASYDITSSTSGGKGGFIYEWSSDCPGMFSNRFFANTTFTAATVSVPTECSVLLQVTDDCGRRIGFSRKTVIIVPAPRPPVAEDDIASTLPGTSITLNVLENDYDLNLDPLTLTSLIGSANTGNGIFTNNGDGTVTYTSNFDFTGIDQIDYQVCDPTSPAKGGPFCDIASIIISVNWTDENGCTPDQYFGIVSSGNADAVIAHTGVSNSNQALGEPIMVPWSKSYYTKIDKDESDPEYLVVDLTDTIDIGDSIRIYFGSDDGSPAELRVQGTLNGTDYSVGSDFYDIQTFTSSAYLYDSNPEQDIAVYLPSTGSIRFLRFTRVNGQGKPGVNGIIYNKRDCINALPIAEDDISTICEDNELIIYPLDNDIDPQGLPLSVSIVTPPSNGIIAISADGVILYRPYIDYNGADNLVYEICNSNNLCDRATIDITIIEDGCAAGEGRSNGGASESVADDFPSNKYDNNTGSENWTSDWIEVNDDGDDGGGDIKVTGGIIEMKADANDIALYREADLANALSAILSFDIAGHDLNNEDVFLLEASIDGGVNYTPLVSYNESDPSNFSENIELTDFFVSLSSNTRIQFRRIDGGGRDKFKFDNVEIRYQKSGCSGSCIPSPSYPPVAIDDAVGTGINTSILIDVIANDSDPSGYGLTTTLGNSLIPNNGSVMLSESNILYSPETNYTGLDSFNYVICNFYGCDSAVVVVDVLCADPGSGNAITGFAFIDDNVNQTMEVGEDGHENLKVLLYDDIDQDGQESPGDIKLDSVYTDQNGYYKFQVQDQSALLVDMDTVMISVRINAGGDDAEEEGPDGASLGNGGMNKGSSDLEFTEDFGGPVGGTQKIGLRFNNIDIPQGAVITQAYMTFRAVPADGSNSNSSNANFTISGEDIDDAETFTTTAFDITNRNTTSSTELWSPNSWVSGLDYDSPDLSSIVQEIVDRPGWEKNNSLAMIITGTGSRSAASYNGIPWRAPQINIEYEKAITPQSAAIWSDGSVPEYNEWNSSSFSTTENTSGLSSRWRIMQSAVSPSKEEKIVVGIQRNNIVSGQKWDGVKWENLSINPMGNVSQNFWSGADVAYEQMSGRALLVWNDNPNLKYSIWDGSNWSAPATIMGPLSGEAKQIRLASKPGSDEIIAVVASIGGDYALVWDGNSWGSGIELDGPSVNANYPGNNTDYRDVSVAYEHLSGRAVVAFGINTGLSQDYALHYKIWDGNTWLPSSFFQPTPTINISSRAKYITLENDPNSNRIVAGIQSTGANGWVTIWDGSTWETPELLTTGSLVLDNGNSQNLTVGFESKSGQALAVYGRGGQNVFYHRNWTVGSGWSSEQIGLNLGDNTNTMEVFPSPVSDTIMLAIQDDGSDINYVAWNGNSWGSMTQMTFYSRETQNKPFTFLWKNSPKSETSSGNYVIKIDTTSIPSNSALTTDATEVSLFLGVGEVDCYNNFGLLPHLPPIAVRDTIYVDKGATVSFEAIENDSDPEGTVLDLTLLSTPSSGTAAALGSGYVEYDSPNNFQGSVQFDYQICDQGIPTLCDTTTITVIVIAKGNDSPIAQNDYDSTVVNSDIVTSVLANDFDPEYGEMAVTVGGGLLLPANGSVFVQNGKKISYTPDLNYTGDDYYEYRVCDDGSPTRCDLATVYIYVSNNPPIAADDWAITSTDNTIAISVMDNDIDIDGHDIMLISTGADAIDGMTLLGGTVSINNNGTPGIMGDDFVDYTPPPGFTGVDTFYYTIEDAGLPKGSDIARVIVSVTELIDLELNKTVIPLVATINDPVTFTLTVVNNGPYTGTEIRVVDRLPSGFSFTNATGDGNYDEVSGIWFVDSLTVGQSASLNINALFINGADAKNIAEVYAVSQKDVDSSPNNDDGDQSEDDEDNAEVLCGSPVTLLLPFSEDCASNATSTLSGGSPSGGIFSGLGVSGTNFDASLAGVGTHTITYEYTDVNGCSNAANQDITVYETPVISGVAFFEPTSCTTPNGSITVNASAGFGLLEYRLNNGTWQTSNIFSNLTSGYYTAEIRNSNGSCVLAYDANPVYLGPPQSPTSNIQLPAEVCQGQTGIFNAQNAGGGAIYSWNFGDGASTASTTGRGPHNVTYSTSGVKNISLTVIRSGCTSVDNKSFTVFTSPEVSLNLPDVEECANSTILLLSGGSPAGGTYTGIGVGGNNFNATLAGVGSHNITYVYTDSNGCIDSASQQIAVISVPDVTAITHTDETCGSNSGSITFTFNDDVSKSALEFSIDNAVSWPVGYNVNDNAGLFTISELIPGTYDLWVRWGSDQCPIDLGSVIIDAEDGPVITEVIATDAYNCPELVNGTITVRANGDNLLYSIDGGSSYQLDSLFVDLSPGTYNVQVQDSLTGCIAISIRNPLVAIAQPCVELCFNGIDDDGDGQVDENDNDCINDCGETIMLLAQEDGAIAQKNIISGVQSILTYSPYTNSNLNALAANPDASLVYYGIGQVVYYWDPATDVHNVLMDLNGLIPSNLSLTNGGGGYYNHYVYMGFEDDSGTDDPVVYRIPVSGNGITPLGDPVDLNIPLNTNTSWGDMIISKEDGDVYLYMTNRNIFDSFSTYSKYNLRTEVYTIINSTMISTLQVGVDINGDLWGGSTSGGYIRKFDKNTGVFYGPNISISGDIWDLTGPINCAQKPEYCNNGIDDDGDGLVDCLDSDCAGDGNADVVFSSSGVTNQNDALGVPDGVSAELYDNGDQMILDLTDIVPLGQGYTITLRRAPSSSNNPIVLIEESTDGVTYTAAREAPFTITSTSYFGQRISSSVEARYLRVTTQNNFNLDVDAVGYSLRCATYCPTATTNPHIMYYRSSRL